MRDALIALLLVGVLTAAGPGVATAGAAPAAAPIDGNAGNAPADAGPSCDGGQPGTGSAAPGEGVIELPDNATVSPSANASVYLNEDGDLVLPDRAGPAHRGPPAWAGSDDGANETEARDGGGPPAHAGPK
ncbi:hypothetical protein [Halomicrobium urmianum]|uniref:hypothetical protein n=1 Tax=Halomicrobium urmianum TaxID=1586233 RepID=UPI001CD96690|nr:hypothetical protein [Halomicrobium urmianum]